jgi:hypothetical protein
MEPRRFCLNILDEDIAYTNWGMTANQLEPSESDSLKCASACLGQNCTESTWKAVDCTAPLNYICQVDCKILVARFDVESRVAECGNVKILVSEFHCRSPTCQRAYGAMWY